MSFAEELGVVVGGCAVDAGDSLFWAAGLDAAGEEALHEEAALEFADFDVVECEVVVERAVADEAVVGADGDAGGVGFLDGAGHGFAVVGGDDEDVDVLGEEGVAVFDLLDVVAVGGEDDDFCAEGLGFGDEGVAVALPAFFFERVEGEADAGLCFGLGRGLGGRGGLGFFADELRLGDGGLEFGGVALVLGPELVALFLDLGEFVGERLDLSLGDDECEDDAERTGEDD